MSHKQIAMIVLPMVSGTLSIAASSTIVIKVLKSRSRFSTPYNRLLIGLCLYDIIISTCQGLSTVPVPRGSRGYWLALGNETTCKIQGTVTMLSVVSTPLYNLALCFYFLCVVKFNMTDEKFRNVWEPFLHGFNILYGIVTAIVALALDYVQPAWTMCWINSPTNPMGDAKSLQFTWIVNGGPILAIFVGMVIIFLSILWTVYKQERTMNRYRFQLNSGAGGRTNSVRSQQNTSRVRSRINAVKTRANCFFVAYMLTWTPVYTYRILAQREWCPPNVLYVFGAVARFMVPLQGVLNMMAHLHPQVISIRRENPSYWYLRALYTALNSLDTDLDSRGGGGRRRRSRLQDSLTAVRSSSRLSSLRSSLRESVNTFFSGHFPRFSESFLLNRSSIISSVPPNTEKIRMTSLFTPPTNDLMLLPSRGEVITTRNKENDSTGTLPSSSNESVQKIGQFRRSSDSYLFNRFPSSTAGNSRTRRASLFTSPINDMEQSSWEKEFAFTDEALDSNENSCALLSSNENEGNPSTRRASLFIPPINDFIPSSSPAKVDSTEENPEENHDGLRVSSKEVVQLIGTMSDEIDEAIPTNTEQEGNTAINTTDNSSDLSNVSTGLHSNE